MQKYTYLLVIYLPICIKSLGYGRNINTDYEHKKYTGPNNNFDNIFEQGFTALKPNGIVELGG